MTRLDRTQDNIFEKLAYPRISNSCRGNFELDVWSFDLLFRDPVGRMALMQADPRSPWEVQYSGSYYSSPKRRFRLISSHNTMPHPVPHPHTLGLPLDVIVNHSESRPLAEDPPPFPPLHGSHSGIDGRVWLRLHFVLFCLSGLLTQVVIGLLGCMLWRPVRACSFCRQSHTRYSWTDQGIAAPLKHRYRTSPWHIPGRTGF